MQSPELATLMEELDAVTSWYSSMGRSCHPWGVFSEQGDALEVFPEGLLCIT